MLSKNPAKVDDRPPTADAELSVVALVLPGVVMIDLAIPAQIFGHVAEAARYDFRLCAARAGAVASTTGYSINVPHGLAALKDAHTVVVPGFAPLTPPAQAVSEALRAAAERGARIMSVCTGAFALAAAGLLDGRPVTTHWEDADDLASQYPGVRVDPDVLYIDDGQVLTSAGVCAVSTCACTWCAPTLGSMRPTGSPDAWWCRRTAPAGRHSTCTVRCRRRVRAWPNFARGRFKTSTSGSVSPSWPAAPVTPRGPSPGCSPVRPAQHRSAGWLRSGWPRRGDCSR